MIMLLLFISMVGADCSVQQPNTEYLGFNITTISSVSSTTDCCSYCDSNDLCLAYTYSLPTNSCTLKYYADPGSIQNNTDVVSGQLGPLTGGCNGLYQGLDFPNYNLPGSPYSNVTDPVTCCKMCANISKCVISTWVENVGCYLKYFYSHTELTVQSSTVMCDVNKKWTPYVGSPPSECIFDYYKNYMGGNISTMFATDPATCCANCRSNSQCMFANFNVNTLICTLKSDITQYTYDMNYVAIFPGCKPWTTCCNSTGQFVPLGGTDPNCPTHCDGLGNCAALSFKSCHQVYYLYPNLPAGVYNISGNQVYCDKGWQLVSHFSALDGIGNLDLEVYYYYFVDRPIWIEAPPENSTTRYKKYTNPLTPNATFDGLHNFDFIHWGSVMTQVGANYGIRQQFFRSQSSDIFDVTFRLTYDGILLQNDAGPNQPQNPLLLWPLTNRTVLSDTTNITWNTKDSVFFWKPFVDLVPAYSACGEVFFGCCDCTPGYPYSPGHRIDGNAGIVSNNSDSAGSWAPLLRPGNFDLIYIHQAPTKYGHAGGNQTLNYYLMDDNDPNDCLFNYCSSYGDDGSQCVDLNFHYGCNCSQGYRQESWLKTEITYHVTCVLYDPCQINNGGCADICILANLTLLCGCTDQNAYLDNNNVSCNCKDGYVQEEKNKCTPQPTQPNPYFGTPQPTQTNPYFGPPLQSQPNPYFGAPLPTQPNPDIGAPLPTQPNPDFGTPLPTQPNPDIDCQGNYGTLFTCKDGKWISNYTDVVIFNGTNLLNSVFNLTNLYVDGNMLISGCSINTENLFIQKHSVLTLENCSVLVSGDLHINYQSTIILNEFTNFTIHINHCAFLNGNLIINAHQKEKRLPIFTSQCINGNFSSIKVSLTDTSHCDGTIPHIEYTNNLLFVYFDILYCNPDQNVWMYIAIGIVIFSLVVVIITGVIFYRRIQTKKAAEMEKLKTASRGKQFVK